MKIFPVYALYQCSSEIKGPKLSFNSSARISLLYLAMLTQSQTKWGVETFITTANNISIKVCTSGFHE
jgi:hypothetical protein